jgi:hypothetical protein
METTPGEEAFSLAEAALRGAQQALETAKIAERAAVEAASLAMVAMNAAGMAYEHADEVRGSTMNADGYGPASP